MKKVLILALCVASAHGVANATGLSDAQVSDMTQTAIATDQAQSQAAQFAQWGASQNERGSVMLDVKAPGCLVKGPDGQPLSLAGKQNDMIQIPRGTTFSASCLVQVNK